MSEQLKDNAGTDCGQAGPLCCGVVVKCSRPVYRRAGFAFVRGKNTLENVSPEQLAILRSDPVLSLVSEAPVPPDALPGGMDVLDVGGLDARIRDAVATLDKANVDHFTQSGAPRVAAVSGALGENISAAQLYDLRNRGLRLPGVTTTTLKRSEPALVALYRVTGNSRQWQRMARRNGVKNPLFVPGGIEVEVIDE